MVEVKDFDTNEINTWCPGCLNYPILNGMKKALTNLVNDNIIKKENIAMVSGIGCAAKIFDYIKINGVYSIHGRTIPTALGMKVANPELDVICFGGDGDVYAEGIQHLVHGARKNLNMTMIVHDNQIFALTTGQTTPTTEPGYNTKSTPFGSIDRPLNPILFALSCGATFVARASVLELGHLTKVFEEAIKHKGFSFVEVLQPCLTFHNHTKDLINKTYEIEKTSDIHEAIKNALIWDYVKYEDVKIPIGIFYQIEKQDYNEKLINKEISYKIKRDVNVKDLISEFK